MCSDSSLSPGFSFESLRLWSTVAALPQVHRAELEAGLDISKYVAGGIVVFDIHTRAVKWRQHLDLSTDSTSFRAYIYSAPLLVDLDRDGKLEIVVGTSAVWSSYCADVHAV